MIIEKQFLLSLVEEFITNNCSKGYPHNDKFPFKTYLKKDENGCFTIMDKKHCIKCVFNKQSLQNYFQTYPSYVNINQYEGMLIMVKQAHFDVIMYKNVNRTISYRVILIITEFDLDQGQKMSSENYNVCYKNVNFESKIAEMMEVFYFNYMKTHVMKKLQGEQKVINAENFMSKFYEKDKCILSVTKVISDDKDYVCVNGSEKEFEFVMWEGNNSGNNSSSEEMFLLKEIRVEHLDDKGMNDDYDKTNDDNDDDVITVEKLSKLDFKALFYKQPSQVDKEKKDFSHYEKINLNNEQMIGNKRERNKINMNNNMTSNNNNNNGCESEDKEKNDDLEKMPVGIKNLIKKMEGKPQLTIRVFEKYKNFKKYNSNEYVRDNN